MGTGVKRSAATVARWTAGVLLVSWRYLWEITPLHRTVEAGDRSDVPRALPDELVDSRNQLLEHGVGPLFRRLFTVDVTGAHLSAEQLIDVIATDLKRVIPSEVTTVEDIGACRGGLQVGDEMVIRIPGPWNGPVRVVHRSPTCFRFATLTGHLEAGQIEFRARPQAETLRFEIEAWARPATRLVHLLYTHVRLAKEIQLNMWVRCCLATAGLAGGHPRSGVTITTRVVGTPFLPGPEAESR